MHPVDFYRVSESHGNLNGRFENRGLGRLAQKLPIPIGQLFKKSLPQKGVGKRGGIGKKETKNENKPSKAD